ncbi:RimJ/RimL family protein N-acetyltransferase [Melghirimyces profundicolus]|uniref:RimJ/RimL family protein N-acetyltransferase n=1 Tax=Melghirimyces profundicolus TaxID=1242148 RepID=A0A2T6C7I4_9BACL|nr:GNAT family protein [Melghirimyces profundicolus]PTX64252.1 RimJ/RimL family protein N-acetyltransferase [Melghirimyces profundicolus]
MHIRIPGSRVVLRDLEPGDPESIWYWKFESEDREHHRWNGPYYSMEAPPREDFDRRWGEELNRVGTLRPRRHLVIEIDGELKGTVNRYWVDPVTRWFEIGLVIFDSRCWSRGCGTEAFQMWIDYLFLSMDTVRLGISTWSGNERMIRLADRCGMVEEGRIRKARIVEGRYYDSVKMGLLREEWESGKRADLPLFYP